MGGINTKASQGPAGETGGIREVGRGYLQGRAGDINQIIEKGFRMAEERKKGSGATDGSNTAQTPNEIGVHTENLTEGKSGGPADGTIETSTPLTSTVEAATAAHVPAPAASEVRAAVNEKPPTEDWEAILEADKQQKYVETQQEWIDLMNAIEASKGAVPHFVTLGTKGENSTTDQRSLILIQPYKDEDSEKFLVLTKDGPRTIDGTVENKKLILLRLLQKEDQSTAGALEKVQSVPLALTEGLDLTLTPVVNQSKDMAGKINDKKNEMRTLDISKALAEKIKSSLTSQTHSGMSNS